MSQPSLSFDDDCRPFDSPADDQGSGNASKQKIGTYLIDCTIGKGNFSIVKLATHTITQMKVAIKIIDKNKLSGNNLKNMYREVNILKRLRHKNIIQLFQIMESEKLLYIVMEYASRGELFELIASRGKLPEKEACSKMIEIVTALQYCHANNIVHRDIKSENILFDAFGTIKLTDFGFGNVYQQGQTLSTYCGSPPYAAPEIFMGIAYDGKKADIWSLGVLLYVIVCGSLPFDAPSLKMLKELILHGRYRVPFWMSHECEHLIKRLLTKCPQQRPDIDQIPEHKWFKKFLPQPAVVTSNSSVQDNNDHFNELALKVLEKSGMPRNTVLDSLQREAYDHIMATYLLLVDKLRLCAKDTHGEYWWLSQWDLYQRRRHSAAATSSMSNNPVKEVMKLSDGSTVEMDSTRRRCSEVTSSVNRTVAEAALIHGVPIVSEPRRLLDNVTADTATAAALENVVQPPPSMEQASNCATEEETAGGGVLESNKSPRSSVSAESGIGSSSDCDSRRQSSARSSLSCGGNMPWRMSIPSPQLCSKGHESLSIDEGMEELCIHTEEEENLPEESGRLHRSPECANITTVCAHSPILVEPVSSGADTCDNECSGNLSQLTLHCDTSQLHVPTLNKEIRRNSDSGVINMSSSASNSALGECVLSINTAKVGSALEDTPVNAAASSRKLGETGRVGGIFFKVTSKDEDSSQT